VSAHKTEGNGVGDLSVPPVKLIDLEGCRKREDKPLPPAAATNGWDVRRNGWRLTVNVKVCDAVNLVWETIVIGCKLFVEVPKFVLPDGSKERYACICLTICIFLTCTTVILDLLSSVILVEIIVFVKGSSSVF